MKGMEKRPDGGTEKIIWNKEKCKKESKGGLYGAHSKDMIWRMWAKKWYHVGKEWYV